MAGDGERGKESFSTAPSPLEAYREKESGRQGEKVEWAAGIARGFAWVENQVTEGAEDKKERRGENSNPPRKWTDVQGRDK